MKKIITVLLVTLLQFAYFCPVYADTYTNDDMNVSFDLPEGWEEVPLTAERETIKAKFQIGSDSKKIVMFGGCNVVDLYNENSSVDLTSKAFEGYRLTEEDIGSMMEDDTYKEYIAEDFEGVTWYRLYSGLQYVYTAAINQNMLMIMYFDTLDETEIEQVKAIVNEITIDQLTKEGTISKITTSSDIDQEVNDYNQDMFNSIFWIIIFGIGFVIYLIIKLVKKSNYTNKTKTNNNENTTNLEEKSTKQDASITNVDAILAKLNEYKDKLE